MPSIKRAAELASAKTLRLERRWKVADGAPVIHGWRKIYRAQLDAVDAGLSVWQCADVLRSDRRHDLLAMARRHVVADMAEHLTHTGVHDHGFNNISTYGHLRRLMLAGRIEHNDWELNFYELALKVSGAVQAARWTAFPTAATFTPSMAATRCSSTPCAPCASVVWRICLGTRLWASRTARQSAGQAAGPCKTSAEFNIYYGEGRDHYDVPELRGRTAHEAIFNPASGVFRCPSSQQGYSPFTTWTRGLAWAMLGFAEQLEFIQSLPKRIYRRRPSRQSRACAMLERAARATCDFYIHQASALDGICYWDTGAPQLHLLGDWNRSRRSLQRLRAGRFLGKRDRRARACSASAMCLAMRSATCRPVLRSLQRLLEEPYLSMDPDHEGILLHSVYHRPNGGTTSPTAKIPCGESSMWGDYHLLEVMLLVTKLADRVTTLSFSALQLPGEERRTMASQGKVALVTGGARGIGLGIALKLARPASRL